MLNTVRLRNDIGPLRGTICATSGNEILDCCDRGDVNKQRCLAGFWPVCIQFLPAFVIGIPDADNVRVTVMNSLRTTLTVLGAIFAALLIPTLWSMAQGIGAIGSQRQTGIGAIAGGVSEFLLSPVFWVLALLFFFFFLRMSKVGSEAVRILFFWIPTVAASCIGLLLVGGYTFLFLHFRRH